MGLGASLTSFSANTLMQSSQVNTNFSNLANVSAMTGTLTGESTTTTYATDVSSIQTNGGTSALQFTPIVSASGFSSSVPTGYGQVQVSGGLRDLNANHHQAWGHFSGSGSGTYNLPLNNIASPNFLRLSPLSSSAQSSASGGATGAVAVYLSAAVAFNAASGLSQ